MAAPGDTQIGTEDAIVEAGGYMIAVSNGVDTWSFGSRPLLLYRALDDLLNKETARTNLSVREQSDLTNAFMLMGS